MLSRLPTLKEHAKTILNLDFCFLAVLKKHAPNTRILFLSTSATVIEIKTQWSFTKLTSAKRVQDLSQLRKKTHLYTLKFTHLLTRFTFVQHLCNPNALKYLVCSTINIKHLEYVYMFSSHIRISPYAL